ncbi:MAG: hypothetical protein AB9903_12950 [Vulcanimicrobiota bacterium]
MTVVSFPNFLISPEKPIRKRPMEGILPYDEWAERNPGPASVTEEQEEDLMALGDSDFRYKTSSAIAQSHIDHLTKEQSAGGAPWWQRRQK